MASWAMTRSQQNESRWLNFTLSSPTAPAVWQPTRVDQVDFLSNDAWRYRWCRYRFGRWRQRFHGANFLECDLRRYESSVARWEAPRGSSRRWRKRKEGSTRRKSLWGIFNKVNLQLQISTVGIRKADMSRLEWSKTVRLESFLNGKCKIVPL